MSRIITFVEAIQEATDQSMKRDKDIILFGLGVDDPKRIFGSTAGLKEKYGEERVFDVPTSENAITGIGVGASIAGKKSIMVHQRLDFFLLAMDQVVNSAAKWFYMFGGQQSIPITIRLIMGRGWGQGPTHSQNLQAWFAHIPGLKVVMPATAQDAKGLLISSIQDKNPVIFLEHRWLHNMTGNVSKSFKPIPLGKANIIKEGNDVSIIAMSYMVVEALEAQKFLLSCNITIEVIDLRTVAPVDYKTLFKSIKKTKRAIVLDTGHLNGSISAEISAKISESLFDILLASPKRLALPDYPEGTSFGLTDQFHPNAKTIVDLVCSELDIKINTDNILHNDRPHDVPGDWFKGPF